MKHLFVIFGATGDLARRKLIPALYRVVSRHGIAADTALLGVSLDPGDDAGFREEVESTLSLHGLAGDELRRWCAAVHYHQVTPNDDFAGLATRIAAIEDEHDLPGNRIFYLALPPAAFIPTIDGLGTAGLAAAPGWVRLVVEKPFGRDLASAEELNRVVHRYFSEEQVFRIDHYLGKETVQNLLTFRFANLMFESTWNRDRVAAVDITVAETLGVEGRAGYYDRAGVVRDMMQNHLTQLLTLVAMEPPSSFTADPIRNEKVQVLESIRSFDPSAAVLGQYTAGVIQGETVPGYREEAGIPPDSATPTYAEITLGVDNYRWQGVPFTLRTGKRLPERTTEIVVTYQRPPVCIFHGIADECRIGPNAIVLSLQPHEGFAVRFEVKAPGEPLQLVSKPLTFDYEQEFREIPDAYETLILDVIEGDQTLFVRHDEVEASWRLWDRLLQAEVPVLPYPAGTWGPKGSPPPRVTGTR